jgi:hypothetical protein
MKRTVTNLQGEREYINLPKPLWVGRNDWGTGVTLVAVFRGPRTHRLFIHTYSIWEDRQTLGRRGDEWDEVGESTWLSACECAGIEPTITASEI